MSAPLVAPTLTDGVVTLRAHRADDVPRLVEQCRDPEMIAWTQVPVPYDEAEAATFAGELVPQWWAEGTDWSFAVEVEGRFGGTVSLRDEGSGRFEVAFGAHPDVRGTGALERAVRLLLGWGFAEQGAQTVVWRALTGNWASRRLAWRLGFGAPVEVRGLLPHRATLRDAWVATLLAGDEQRPTQAWLDNPVVESEGLRLRPFTAADVPRVVEGLGDAQTQHWLAFLPREPGEPEGRAYVDQVTDRLASGHTLTWAVAAGDDDRLLGVVGIYRIKEEPELGYWAHPQARGQGVVTRACRAAVGHAFDELGLPRLAAHVAVPNHPSRGVLDALGFQPTGVRRRAVRTGDGRAVDVADYDLLASEWPVRSTVNATASTAKPASDSPAPSTSGDR